MKVIKVTTTNSETSASLDLFNDMDLKPRVKRQIQENVGDYLIEQTLMSVNSEKSPISGEGKFPALKNPYKKLKAQEVGNTEPNLELSGTMLDSLEYRKTADGIDIGVYGKAAPRADGHCDLSGDSRLPKRQFIPNVGDEYNSKITRDVQQIIEDTIVENTDFKESDFEDVETSRELYNVLKSIFVIEATKTEIRDMALRNEDLLALLTELDLLDLL